MNEEIQGANTCVPAQRNELYALTTAIKLAGSENIYPKEIGSFTVGDAHWATLINSKMYDNIQLNNTIADAVNTIDGGTVSLHSGRFLSWVIAEQLDKKVDEIIITDPDPWVEKVTTENLQEALDVNVIRGNGDDKTSSNNAKNSIITTTIRPVADIISTKTSNAIKFV